MYVLLTTQIFIRPVSSANLGGLLYIILVWPDSRQGRTVNRVRKRAELAVNWQSDRHTALCSDAVGLHACLRLLIRREYRAACERCCEELAVYRELHGYDQTRHATRECTL